jgi:hypothetical protein
LVEEHNELSGKQAGDCQLKERVHTPDADGGDAQQRQDCEISQRHATVATVSPERQSGKHRKNGFNDEDSCRKLQ